MQVCFRHSGIFLIPKNVSNDSRILKSWCEIVLFISNCVLMIRMSKILISPLQSWKHGEDQSSCPHTFRRPWFNVSGGSENLTSEQKYYKFWVLKYWIKGISCPFFKLYFFWFAQKPFWNWNSYFEKLFHKEGRNAKSVILF